MSSTPSATLEIPPARIGLMLGQQEFGGIEAHAVGERADPAELVAFRRKHRQVGAGEQVVGSDVGRIVGLRHRHANAGPDEHLPVADHGRIVECPRDAFGDAAGRRRLVLDQHGELVAPEPCHGVSGAHAVLDPVGDCAQQVVACGRGCR